MKQLEPGKTEMYSFCGLGAHCSIATGKPSQTRGQLVRREALETALYTFKYMPVIDSVIVFMPPRKDIPNQTSCCSSSATRSPAGSTGRSPTPCRCTSRRCPTR